MTRKTLIPVIAASALLAGCAGIEPPENPGGQRTTNGAIIGGMIGALVGATSDDSSAGKTVAAGVLGAAIGGAIGHALDKQAGDLERRINNPDVTIENTGSELIVTLPQDILFDVDSTALRPDLQSDIRALAANLRDYPDSTVDIIGHTDNTGAAEYNQDLSARRAGAVAGVLYGEGIPTTRVRSFGRGETEPVATNLTPEGRLQNRRVEIIIRPTT